MQYFLKGLERAVSAAPERTRVQNELARVVEIVGHFVDVISVPSFPAEGSVIKQRDWRDACNNLAVYAEVQSIKIIQRAKAGSAKRKRGNTGLVSGVLCAWGQLAEASKITASRSPKLQFSEIDN